MTKPLDAQIPQITIPAEAAPFLAWSLEDDQLSCRQAAILMVIRANPGMSVGSLAAAIGVPKPSITRASDKLVKMGYLKKQTDYLDRRLVKLVPTRKK